MKNPTFGRKQRFRYYSDSSSFLLKNPSPRPANKVNNPAPAKPALASVPVFGNSSLLPVSSVGTSGSGLTGVSGLGVSGTGIGVSWFGSCGLGVGTLGCSGFGCGFGFSGVGTPGAPGS